MSDEIDDQDGLVTRPIPKRREPDAHGQAALLLAESTLHALIETNLLSIEQATSVVQTAREVKVAVAEETGETEGRMKQSLALLVGIERSLTAGDGDR